MTKEQVKENAIKLLGEEHIEKSEGKWFITFNKTTPNVWITPGFQLHEFLTKNKGDSTTRLDIRLLADMQNIYNEAKGEIEIVESYMHPDQKPANPHIETDLTLSWYRKGLALCFRDKKPKVSGARRAPKRIRELQKATRKTKKSGARFIHKDCIMINTLFNWFFEESKQGPFQTAPLKNPKKEKASS